MTGQSNANGGDKSIFIADKQCEIMYSNTILSQISSIIIGTLFSGILYRWTGRSEIWIWFIFVVAASCGRMLLFRNYRRRGAASPKQHRWLHYHFVAVTISGVVWSCGTVLFFTDDVPTAGFFIAMIAAGLVSGALPVLAAHYPSFCIFSIPILSSFAVRSLLAGSDEYYVLGACTILFAGVMLSSARYFNSILLNTLRLNRENESLVEHLKHERDLAQAAARAKSMFLANMSHEIRTPMNGIIGMTELCLTTGIDSQQKGYLDAVRISAENLLSIINDILDFSKIEAGKLELASAPFLLRETVAQTLQSLSVRGVEKGVEVVFSPAAAVPDSLVGDSGRLRQVLINLVGNAIKFTPRGEVIVGVGMTGEADDHCRLCFTVRDDGIGIDPEKISVIFNPFEQGDLSTTKSFGGTGLGLAISRKLVESLGGEITVESAPGKGSTFTFTARFALEPSAQKAQAEPSLKGRRALVVDGGAGSREPLPDYLRSWGMAAARAENATAALAMLDDSVREENRFDFVLVYLQIPEAGGWKLLEEIRRHPLHARLPCLAISSAGMPDRGECGGAGFQGLLSKPVVPSQLRDLLCRMLPCHEEPRQPEKKTPPRLQEPARRLSILVAEDIPINQALIETILTRHGHAVTMAGNGEEAVQAWQGDPETFDVIFMDVQMPGMDGLQATGRIRELEASGKRRIPIVAMTAYARDEDRERCREAGMDDYLSKPFQQKDISSLLERLTAGLQT